MGSKPANSTERRDTAAVIHAQRVTPVPTILRGRLFHVLGDVAFTEFKRAACAWSAAEAHRLDIVEGGAA
jgi:hypothetical protein